MGAYILSIESGDRKIPRAHWLASPASSVVRDPVSKKKKQASKQQSSPDMLLWPLHVHTQCMHLYSDIHVPHMNTRTHKKVKHMFECKLVGHVYSHST